MVTHIRDQRLGQDGRSERRYNSKVSRSATTTVKDGAVLSEIIMNINF